MKIKSLCILITAAVAMMIISACQSINTPSIPVNQGPTEITDDTLYAVRDNGLYGYVNSKGQVIIKPQYSFAYDFSEGLAMVDYNGKMAYIDRSGNVAIKTEYEALESFKEGLAAVIKDGKCGFIDKSGKFIIEPKYDYVMGFSQGLALVGKGGKYGYLDKTGNLVIEMKYDFADSFKEGLAKVSTEGKNYYINEKGETILTPDAEGAYGFNDGMALIYKGGKYGFIDNKGKIVVKPVYDDFSEFSEGLAAVSLDGKWGYIDKKGVMVIKPQYKSALKFKEGLAPVLVGGDWQYINKEGITEIKNKFNIAYHFSNGFAVAEINGEVVLINTNGEILWHETDSFAINGKNEELGKITKNRVRSGKYDMMIAYPHIELMDKNIEKNVNEIMKKHFNVDYKGQQDETFDGDYLIKLNKNGVLSILEQVYTYTGGAHGMVSWRGISFDLNKGKAYKLEELFKKDSGYEKKLNELIKKDINTKEIELLRPFEGIYDEQEYYLTDKSIVIYYQLYDYTPYAYGFLHFEIPYEDIKGMIDEGGPLGQMNK